jgi:hypothetical protein
MQKGQDTVNLVKHLEKYKNKLASKIVPDRHKGSEESYFDYVRREIARTSKKIESITGVPVK